MKVKTIKKKLDKTANLSNYNVVRKNFSYKQAAQWKNECSSCSL